MILQMMLLTRRPPNLRCPSALMHLQPYPSRLLLPFNHQTRLCHTSLDSSPPPHKHPPTGHRVSVRILGFPLPPPTPGATNPGVSLIPHRTGLGITTTRTKAPTITPTTTRTMTRMSIHRPWNGTIHSSMRSIRNNTCNNTYSSTRNRIPSSARSNSPTMLPLTRNNTIHKVTNVLSLSTPTNSGPTLRPVLNASEKHTADHRSRRP